MTELRGGADAGQAASGPGAPPAWAQSSPVEASRPICGRRDRTVERADRRDKTSRRRQALSPQNPSSLSFSLPFLSEQPTAPESLLAVADVLPFPAGHLLVFSLSQNMPRPAA